MAQTKTNKTKAVAKGIQLASVLRKLLSGDKALKNRELMALARQEGATVNEKTFSVSAAEARRALGITGSSGEKSVKVVATATLPAKPRAWAPDVPPPVTPDVFSHHRDLAYDVLTAARDCVKACGGIEQAIAHVKLVSELQV